MRSFRSRSQFSRFGSGSRPGFGSSGMLVVVLAALIGLSGCKTPDFIGQRYSNFTAYYNTFYNAERQFKAGYDNLDRFGAEVDRQQYLPLFVKTTGTSASREFEQTVLKSADILREHPDSKWVDDALMLIGKSYFYQENYVGAIQKFTEVVDQQTGLRDEAQFWLARSLMTSGAYDAALEVLTLSMAQEDADQQWVAQDRLLLAELAIRQELWEDAASHLVAGLDEVKDKELAARASFLLGQVQETLGNYDAAYVAYRNVREYPAPYELDYAARYSAIRVDGMYLDADRALRDVRKMERDDKNVIKTAELRFLRARILQDIGGDDEAVFTYEELLYDPLALPVGASLGDLRGRIHYALGELYRDVDRNYVMAAAHFDTAAAALGNTSTTRSTVRTSVSSNRALAPEAIQDAAQLKNSFSRYASVYRDVARYDSLLVLGSLPQEEYDERILELRRKRAEVLREQRRLMEQRQRDQAFRENAGQANLNANRGLQPGKVIPVHGDPTGTAAGYLSHEDPIRVQEGRLQFQNVWGNRPLVPNWRRSSALSAADVQVSEADLAEQEAILEQMESTELPDIDDSAVPRDSTKQVEMRGDRAIARYELGNILFLGMSRPDSAAVWYRQVIEEDSGEAVASRAQYALAEVQRALGDSLSAMRLYRDLLTRYPDSDFIPSVQDRLGMEINATVASDSSAMALGALERAMTLRDTRPGEAIDSLLTVASVWIEYPEAPRALFAVSNIHLALAEGDSASIFNPIPFTIHTDMLAPLWPDKFKTRAELDSLAAEAVRAREVADSLFAAQIAMADSTAEIAAISDSTLAVNADTMVSPADSSGLAPSGESIPSEADPDTRMDVVADSLSMDTPVAVADSAVVDSAIVDSAVAADSTLADTPNNAMDMAAAPDSLVSEMVPPELLTPADSEQDGSMPKPELTIEDVLQKIVSMESRTALGLRARSTLEAIVELRTPPEPDSVTVDGLSADSLAMAALPDSPGMDSLESDTATIESNNVVATEADSLRSIVSGETARMNDPGISGASTDSLMANRGKVLEPDSTITTQQPSQAALSDSEVMALVAQAAARQDSLRAAQARAVPQAARPANQVEEEEGEEIRSSFDLKPMLPNGQLDEEAVGYTFTFGSHFTQEEAQAQFRELRTLLAETGIDLYLISSATGERKEFLVGWGLFLTRLDRDAAAAEFSEILPERRNILHLLPTE